MTSNALIIYRSPTINSTSGIISSPALNSTSGSVHSEKLLQLEQERSVHVMLM